MLSTSRLKQQISSIDILLVEVRDSDIGLIQLLEFSNSWHYHARVAFLCH